MFVRQGVNDLLDVVQHFLWRDHLYAGVVCLFLHLVSLFFFKAAPFCFVIVVVVITHVLLFSGLGVKMVRLAGIEPATFAL